MTRLSALACLAMAGRARLRVDHLAAVLVSESDLA